MKEIEFSLELNETNFQNLSIKETNEFEITPDIKIRCDGPKIIRLSEETPWLYAFTIVISSGASVSLNILSSWLYDKFKNRTHDNRITFSRRTTEFDKGEILKIIEEELKIQ